MENIEEVAKIVAGNRRWILKTINNTYPNASVRLEKETALECDLVIAACKPKNIYVAWNGVIHGEKVVYGETHEFTITGNLSSHMKKFTESDVIVPCYKCLYRSRKKEKVVLIKPEFIMAFLNNPFSYLMPTPDDNGYDADCLFALPNNDPEKTIKEFEEDNRLWVDKERECHSCIVANRDAKFRRRVFSKYDHPHCVVCNIDCEPVLEAAHIIAVKDGGSDAPENGVCLCANHHLLFDRGFFKIDPTTNVISDVDPAVESYLR